LAIEKNDDLKIEMNICLIAKKENNILKSALKNQKSKESNL
jgi:hypothetical protein